MVMSIYSLQQTRGADCAPAIQKEVQFVVRESSKTGECWGRVKAQGQVIEFRAYTRFRMARFTLERITRSHDARESRRIASPVDDSGTQLHRSIIERRF